MGTKTAAVFMVLAGAAAFAQSPAANAARTAAKNADVVIPVAEITAEAAFYPADIDGTRLEVLAVKAPDGTIRTAFNTCQVCYASGRGFYRQEGSVLVCQNCRNRFRMSQVGRQSGGCNPVPILAENKTLAGDAIIIPKDFLRRSKGIFANWKRQ
ncbi:DUF2318 domain-containing protein [Treponema endosymbiont of Eucomonympha sp.]|uniref:DUF2318 domain-containing protein n=1 Tax=Treponema endosymbiont of Eucomonympha sp. TaxID=1580831 RepID=UPI000780B18A|nr:DUF2318 domain-containing protein [Treponema endosymbiont of Eucomonympha sp.]